MKEYTTTQENIERARRHLVINKFGVPAWVDWCDRSDWFGALIALSREDDPLVEAIGYIPTESGNDPEASYEDGEWYDSGTGDRVNIMRYWIRGKQTARLKRLREEYRREPAQLLRMAMIRGADAILAVTRNDEEDPSPGDRWVAWEEIIGANTVVRVVVEVSSD